MSRKIFYWGQDTHWYPGFSCNRVCFLPSSWHRAVFWIWEWELNLSFSCCWVVLTPSQRLFNFPCSTSEEVHKKFGGSTARTGGLNWTKGYSILWWSEYKLRGIVRAGGWSLLRDALGTGQQVMSNCTVHPLFLLHVISLSIFIISLFFKIVITIIIIIFSFISVIKLFSTHHFTFFPLNSSPCPTGAGVKLQHWVMQHWDE